MWWPLLTLMFWQAPLEAPPTAAPAAVPPSAAPATTAQATAPPPPPVAAAVDVAAPRILVMVPTGETVGAEVRRAIASTLTVELGKTGRFTALSSSELSQLADLEADKQAVGCDSSSCLGEIAGALGARWVVFGDATQLGELMVVNLSLFDVERASSVRRTSFEVRSQEEIPARARTAAATLTGTELVAGSEQAAPASSLPLLPVTLVVAGGLVLLGGVGFDALSPTSNNHALDAGDFVGPTALVGGAAVIVVGALWWSGS